MRRVIGLALVAIGVIGSIWGGVTYVKDRNTVDLGVAKVSIEEKDRIPIPPIASGVALAAGVLLIFTSRRR